MKITKTFVGIFILTFIVGLTSFILIRQFNDKPTQTHGSEISIERLPIFMPQKQLIEKKAESEIIEENNDWQNEDDTKFGVKLLESGEGFHGDEITARSGETWLGLFEEKEGFFLEPTKLKIRRVHDPIIDGYYEKESTQKTGKSVFTDKNSEPVFLVKNAKMLSQGSITTLYRYNDESENSDTIEIRNGFIKEFKIGEVSFTVKARKGKNEKQEDILALIIVNGNISQTIHSLNYFDAGDYLGRLKWVGDLDRDGKPDFYFSLYIHDNIEYRNLFLSSQADRGKLVKQVAMFHTSGC